ncbi:hypothetical protein K501DRAFT_278719 [Backusella circina FSU 941]|nr:hypothetical protein K501DRAFT_278719 [Backusella circina FSU 941]
MDYFRKIDSNEWNLSLYCCRFLVTIYNNRFLYFPITSNSDSSSHFSIAVEKASTPKSDAAIGVLKVLTKRSLDGAQDEEEEKLIKNMEKAVQFILDEEQLRAMDIQLKRSNGTFNGLQCYKGDGILKYEVEKQTVEILLLETSSGYDEASNTKKGFDHHKATFGLLAMLKVIADEWEMGSFKSFSNIKMYFLHACGTKARVWSLCSPKENVYDSLKKTQANIRILKKEDEEQMKKYCFNEYSSPENILSSIVNPQIMKLTERNNSAGMGKQLPISFLESQSI